MVASVDRSKDDERDGPYGPEDSDPYLNHPDLEIRALNPRVRDAERERWDRGSVSPEELRRDLTALLGGK